MHFTSTSFLFGRRACASAQHILSRWPRTTEIFRGPTLLFGSRWLLFLTHRSTVVAASGAGCARPSAVLRGRLLVGLCVLFW